MGRKQRLGFHTYVIWLPDEVGSVLTLTTCFKKSILSREYYNNHHKIICQQCYMVAITPIIMTVDVFTHDWVEPKGKHLAKIPIKNHDWVHLRKTLFYIQKVSEFTKCVLKQLSSTTISHRTAEIWGHSLPHPTPWEMTSAKTPANPFSYSNTHIYDD